MCNVLRTGRRSSKLLITACIITYLIQIRHGWESLTLALPVCSSWTGTNYIETLRVQVHANCRIRRIYFSDRLYSEEELP